MTINTAKEIKDFLRKDNDSWYGHILEDEEGHIVLNEDGSVKEFSSDNVDYGHWANNINRWCRYYLPANSINPNNLKLRTVDSQGDE